MLAPQLWHHLWCDLMQAVSPLWGHFLPLVGQGSLPGELWGTMPRLSGKLLRNGRRTRPQAVSPWGMESHAGPRRDKFRLQLKKVGKTTRPFRYDLNQIPNDYTVEVRNRFKGLDLIDRVPDELWMEVHDIV